MRKYASFWDRLLAHNIDLLLLLIPLFGLGYFIANDRIFYMVSAMAYLLYHAIFETSGWQATPGKRMLNIRVQTSDFQPLNFFQSLARNFYKFFSALFAFAGFIMIFFHPKNQGLHDRMSGSVMTRL